MCLTEKMFMKQNEECIHHNLASRNNKQSECEVGAGRAFSVWDYVFPFWDTSKSGQAQGLVCGLRGFFQFPWENEGMDSSLKNNPSQALRGIEYKSTTGQSIPRQGYVILKLQVSGPAWALLSLQGLRRKRSCFEGKNGSCAEWLGQQRTPFCVVQLDKSFPLIFCLTVPSPGSQRLKCIRTVLEPEKIPGTAVPALGMDLSYGKCLMPVLYLLKASEHIGSRARLLGSWCPAFS